MNETAYYFLGFLSAIFFAGLIYLKRRVKNNDVLESNEAKESLSLALSATGMGTFVWDITSDKHFWSEQTKNLYGVDPSNGFSFDTILNLIHPDDRERVGITTQKALKAGSDYTVEYRIRQPNKSYRWISVRSRPFLDKNGNPRKLVGVCYDVTDVKSNELRLKRALAARDEFLRLASHELKTPLSALKLQFQMTKRSLEKGDITTTSPEKLDKLVDSTNMQVDRLINTVEKILHEIRIEN
jgi:PAS domain S-box-containing protein